MKRQTSYKGAIVVLAVVAVVFFAAFVFLKPLRYVSTESFVDTDKNCEYTLFFFSLADCPYCVKFTPDWNKLQPQLYKGVCGMRVDSTDGAFKELTQKYNVSSFPTLILLDNKSQQTYTYNEKRSVNAILDWVKRHTRK
jgi:thioredoxin-related protein